MRLVTKILVHSFNGFAKESKDFVEFEGEKYEVDTENEGKPLKNDDGELIPFEDEGGKEESKEEKKKESKKENLDENPSKLSLEELKEINPKVAEILDDYSKKKVELSKIEKERIENEEKKAEQKGEWESLAKKREQDITKEKGEVSKLSDILEKYKGTVDNFYKNLIEQVPEDKRSLIPDSFSNRQAVEYITKNAKSLAISLINQGKGSKIPDSDENLDNESKLAKRLNELREKDIRTSKERKEMLDVAKKLKKVRRDKE